MESDDYFAGLRREGEAFPRACEGNLDAEVPSCPGWTVAKLLSHLGRIHRWAATAVGDESGAAPVGFPPAPEAVTPAWYLGELEALLTTLGNADLLATRWTFSPGHHQAWFWLRRQALETAVHRWDAQAATTTPPEPIEAGLAVDGIDELLNVFAPRAVQLAAPFDLGGTMHLHATDRAGEWVIGVEDSTLRVERTHAKGTVAAQGTASDLYLWLWKRTAGDTLATFGDIAILDTWRLLSWGK
ncbi:MAG: maleylpyruvate isomerase family mycothiol-dependent enzyme [Actinobacteria bacterium]|nr:maleylpyruvate isomerase family mycothiol-dependent enzyme [Actinomycetota bacterium]